MTAPAPSPAEQAAIDRFGIFELEARAAVDVDALDKLREAATGGEWEHITDYHQRGIVEDSIWAGTAPDDGYYISERVSSKADAALIVAAVNALPELLAEVRRGRALREAVDGLAEELDQELADRGILLDRVIRPGDRLRAVVAAVDGGGQ